MRQAFPAAPAVLPPEAEELVVRLAQVWVGHPSRPRPEPKVLDHWDELIEMWADDRSLPLYTRKAANNRGSALPHHSGRVIVPTDNSPAHWSFAAAVLGMTPTLEDVRMLVASDSIPVAMILKSVERRAARFKCTLGKVPSPNASGWKLAHVDGVGLATTVPLTDIGETQLREHFRRLLSPRNMFVVPTKYSGLGELPEFCAAVRATMSPV
jgi:hypothetical protein